MPPKDKYTDPELRDEVKEEIHEGDKGGAAGQWSARKAQMMASEYKKRGGGYTTDKDHKDESQQHLSNWGDEEWQTKEGSGNAKQDDGTEKRYLPKKAWENMTEEEKEQTDKKKLQESKEGKQFVGNTPKAKESRKKASKASAKQNGSAKAHEDKQENEEDDATGDDADAEFQDDYEAAVEEDGEEENEDEGADDAIDGDEVDDGGEKKRKATHSSEGVSKKQKDNTGKGKSRSNDTVGSKHQSAKEPAPKGSVDRLPEVGQKVQWKSLPGYVEGEVVEIVTEHKDVEGKAVKGSEKDPRIILKSSSSGKIAVHKAEACYYEDA